MAACYHAGALLRQARNSVDPNVASVTGTVHTDVVQGRTAGFLAADPGGSRGVHRYVPEDFGLDLGEIPERFAEYCGEFDVPLSA